MARVADYSNTHKYSNRRSFDGQPVPVGMVLVPFRKDLYDLKEDDYIDANFTTMHLGEIPYVIGFMPIKDECFEGYMKDFWAEINADMLMKREGRCIIGKNPDGSVKTCPYTRRCKGCPNKGLLERYNPNRIEMLSMEKPSILRTRHSRLSKIRFWISFAPVLPWKNCMYSFLLTLTRKIPAMPRLSVLACREYRSTISASRLTSSPAVAARRSTTRMMPSVSI